MENQSKYREMLDKQPRNLRTFELANRINEVASLLPDDQPIAPLVAPWDGYIEYLTRNTEEPPPEWKKLMESIDPRETWSIKELLGRVVRFRKLKTVGELRELFEKRPYMYGITQKSMTFGYVAFARAEEQDAKLSDAEVE